MVKEKQKVKEWVTMESKNDLIWQQRLLKLVAIKNRTRYQRLTYMLWHRYFAT